ncbi:MAG: cytochrome c biogenesis protein CcdA [Leptonema sp. (in: bacteria)]
MEWFNSFFSNLQITLQQPFLTLALFFIGGILSAFFPCYYPLIPITIAFLQKRKSAHLWTHPFVYWMGTIFLYFLLGLLAASTGLVLTKILQNGWVVLGIGIIFLYLSFAVIDFVQLEPRFFRKLEEKAKSKDSLFFTFLMGIFSGLAASACVSPALVSVLLFVVQTTSQLEKDFNSLIFGVFLTVFYGAGLGIPFFVSGVIGTKLPKLGVGMDWIKKFFFVLILAIALYQIQKGLLVFHLEGSINRIILVTIVLSSIFIYFALQKFIKDIFYFRKLYTYITIFYVSLFLFLAVEIYGKKNTENNPSTIEENILFKQNYGIYEYKKDLKIYRSFQEALEESKKQGKPIFIDFYADWCTNCVEFGKLMERDKELIEILNKAIILKVYDTDPLFEYFANQTGYEELQIGLPFFVILNSEKKILFKTINFRDKKNFKKFIEGQ